MAIFQSFNRKNSGRFDIVDLLFFWGFVTLLRDTDIFHSSAYTLTPRAEERFTVQFTLIIYCYSTFKYVSDLFILTVGKDQKTLPNLDFIMLINHNRIRCIFGLDIFSELYVKKWIFKLICSIWTMFRWAQDKAWRSGSVASGWLYI